jgi:putative endonuclease
MAKHIKLGIEGECIAADWLQKIGYQLIDRNWRYSHLEIDIVAMQKQTLHFIEVKTRSSNVFGGPELGVNRRKMKRLKRAAHYYLNINPGHTWIQFDIVAITFKEGEPPLIELFEDV